MIERVHAIIVDRADPQQIDAIHAAIKAVANGWWHRFQTVWLVGGLQTAQEWRDAIKPAIAPGRTSVLVLRLPDDAADRNWAYFGVDAKSRNEWLHNNYR